MSTLYIRYPGSASGGSGVFTTLNVSGASQLTGVVTMGGATTFQSVNGRIGELQVQTSSVDRAVSFINENQTTGPILNIGLNTGAGNGVFGYPSAAQNLGVFVATGGDVANTRFSSGAQLRFIAGSTWTASNRETTYDLSLVPSGATGLVTVHAISSAGLHTLGASGGTQTHVVNGAVNPSLGIVGVTTNSNAATGTIGEYVESVISTYTNLPGATTVWGDMTSISLTAGDWDVSGVMNWIANGATITAAIDALEFAISVNSGITTTDQVQGSNQIALVSPISGADRGAAIPAYRISISGTTTVYLKIKSPYITATPQYKCRLSARRMR